MIDVTFPKNPRKTKKLRTERHLSPTFVAPKSPADSRHDTVARDEWQASRSDTSSRDRFPLRRRMSSCLSGPLLSVDSYFCCRRNVTQAAACLYPRKQKRKMSRVALSPANCEIARSRDNGQSRALDYDVLWRVHVWSTLLLGRMLDKRTRGDVVRSRMFPLVYRGAFTWKWRIFKRNVKIWARKSARIKHRFLCETASDRAI